VVVFFSLAHSSKSKMQSAGIYALATLVSKQFQIDPMMVMPLLGMTWERVEKGIDPNHLLWTGVLIGLGYLIWRVTKGWHAIPSHFSSYTIYLGGEDVFGCYVADFFMKYPHFMDHAHLERRTAGKDFDMFIPGTQVSFRDTIHHVDGWLVVQSHSVPVAKDAAPREEYALTIYTDPKVIQPPDYIEKIKKYMMELAATNRTIVIASYQGEQNCVIYRGTRGEKQERLDMVERYYYNTHVVRKVWYQMVNPVMNNPDMYTRIGQIPSAQILLYGPPGTGKSTLAWRIAIALECNVRVIPLLDYKMRKKELFSTCAYLDEIFCFEELDHSMRVMKEEEEKIRTFKGKNPPDTSNRLMLSDLLELFQGSTPVHQRIIIATTNSLECIQTILPALTRPGRLTPVEVKGIPGPDLKRMVSDFFDGYEMKTTVHDSEFFPSSTVTEMASRWRAEYKDDIKEGGIHFEKELCQTFQHAVTTK
jgi:hypothetical protein